MSEEVRVCVCGGLIETGFIYNHDMERVPYEACNRFRSIEHEAAVRGAA